MENSSESVLMPKFLGRRTALENVDCRWRTQDTADKYRGQSHYLGSEKLDKDGAAGWQPCNDTGKEITVKKQKCRQ